MLAKSTIAVYTVYIDACIGTLEPQKHFENQGTCT